MNGVLLVGQPLRERLGADLEDQGYLVHTVDHVASVDDIAAAVLAVKQMTPGGIAAIAVGAEATLLLEAATVLPQLDAIALIGGKLPASRPHYARMRVQVQIHRAERGSGMSADDVTRLLDESNPGQVIVMDWAYPTANDRFVAEPRDEVDANEATIAWDRIRDFLATSLPEVQGI